MRRMISLLGMLALLLAWQGPAPAASRPNAPLGPATRAPERLVVLEVFGNAT